MAAVLPTTSGASLPQSLVKYIVRSSDVISDNRINVLEEGTDRLVWYKESFLSEDEIIEHVVDNATSTTLWTIHKPLRGWYIHLRASSFPPKSFIALAPVPSSSMHHVPAALFFSCRTLSQSPLQRPPAPLRMSTLEQSKASIDSEATSSSRPDSPVHTYPPPPTPPAVCVSPPSPASVHAKLDQIPNQPPNPKHTLRLTTFLLSPHTQPAPPDDSGFFSRVARVFRSSALESSRSFSLFTVLPPAAPPPSSAQPSSTPTSAAPFQPTQNQNKHPQLTGPLAPKPVLVFRDTTPVFTVHQNSGVLELDLDEVRKLGVDVAFWIAVALVYGEFLGDRDGYLAAAAD